MENQEYHDHEEEYHYTDDQSEPGLDSDQKLVDKAVVNDSALKRLGGQIKQNKRIVFGAFAFLLLLLVVYRMIFPVTQVTSTIDLTQGQIVADNSTEKTVSTVTSSTKVSEVKPFSVADNKAMPASVVVSAPANNVVMSSADQLKQLSDKVTSLEQQNTAIMNLLQTQFMQKISDADAERSQIKSQVQSLESHVDGMESAFHQLVKLIDGGDGSKARAQQAMSAQPTASSSSSVGGPEASVVDSTLPQVVTGYTVQAIIPGRAWLKSEAGDTLTVADGDNLKGLGRVTRIDPYDGVVTIDTGKKIITLTYGISGDQA